MTNPNRPFGFCDRALSIRDGSQPEASSRESRRGHWLLTKNAGNGLRESQRQREFWLLGENGQQAMACGQHLGGGKYSTIVSNLMKPAIDLQIHHDPSL